MWQFDEFFQSKFRSRYQNDTLPPLATQEPLMTIQKPYKHGKISEEQKELIKTCETAIAKELFYWRDFKIDLPQSNFINENLDLPNKNKKEINLDLFKTPPNLNELDELSLENGEARKLSQEQLNEIRQTGKFKVPSMLFEGKYHEWQVNGLIIKGNETHKRRFKNILSNSFVAISSIPDIIKSPTPVSMLNSLKQIPNSMLNLIGLLVGKPEEKLWHSLETLLEYKRSEFIFQEFLDELKEFQEIIKKYGSSTQRTRNIETIREKSKVMKEIDGKEIHIDFRIYDFSLVIKLNEFINPIITKVSNEWQKDRHNFVKNLVENENKENLQDENKKSKIIEKILNLCNKEFYKRFINELKKSEEILIKMADHDIIELIEAKIIISNLLPKIQNKIHETFNKQQIEIEKEIRENHTIKSLNFSWVHKETLKQMKLKNNIPNHLEIEEFKAKKIYENLFKKLEKLIISLESNEFNQSKKLINKLEEQIYLLKRDYTWKFTKKKSTDEKWIYENMTIPTQSFIWSAKIFFKKNQPIIKNSCDEYYRKTTESYQVKSNTWFWRWKILAVRSWVWFKNTSSYCKYSIFDSAFSYKALFYLHPFPVSYDINPQTGKEQPSTCFHETVFSKLKNIISSAIQSRNYFEAQPDEGLLGKTITRVFNVVWNYGIVCGLGIPLSLLLNIPMIILSLLLHSLIFLFNFLLSPCASILRFLLNIIIYDIDSCKSRPFSFFPLIFIVIGQFGFGFIVQFLFSFLLCSILIPLFVLLYSILGFSFTSIGYVYDWIIYHLVIKYRAKIPRRDSFSAKRIFGPNLHQDYYFQISHFDALAILQIFLETNELNVFNAKVNAFIDLPQILFSEFCTNVFSPFGLHGGRNEILQTSTERYKRTLANLITNRRKAIPQYDTVNFYQIRLQEEDLQIFLQNAENLIEEFIANRLFNELLENSPEPISAFWTQYDVPEFVQI